MLTVVYQVDGLSGSDSDSDNSKAYLDCHTTKEGGQEEEGEERLVVSCDCPVNTRGSLGVSSQRPTKASVTPWTSGPVPRPLRAPPDARSDPDGK